MRLSPWLAKILLTQSPLHAKQAAENKRLGIVTKKGPGLRLGSAVDRILFGVGDELVTVANHRGKEDERGKIYVTSQESLLASTIASKVADAWPRHRIGNLQRKMVWTSPEGNTCSTMPDHVDLDFRLDTDLKTSWDVSDAEIQRQISKFGYDLAAAAGLEAIQAIHGWTDARFQWVFAETVPPHDVRIIRLDAKTYREGLAKWREANVIWKQCMDSNNWPGMGNTELNKELAFIDAERN